MYKCSNCGHVMSYPHDTCPNCHVLLSGVKCQGCGYTAVKQTFVENNHRCPQCGSIVRIGGGSGVVPAASKNGGNCFVATAVFDDYDCREVIKLRRFRDNYLANYFWGRKFISFYYCHGPALAEYVKQRPPVKAILRRLFELFI